MRVPHFPKYVITGYPKKGWKLIPELKRHLNESPDAVWSVFFTVFSITVFPPLIYQKIKNRQPYRQQFKTDYTVIRDTELETDKLRTYNPDELEAAIKRTGLYT